MTVPEADPAEFAEAFGASFFLEAIAVFGVAYLLVRAATVALSVVAERTPARRITIKMFRPVVKLVGYGAAVYVVLGPLLNLSAAQLLAVSGLLGAAIGFGLQDVAASLLGGLVIVAERPYRVGDKVTIGEHYGEVVDIGLRATTIRTPDDTAVVVPNDALFSSNIANANAGDPEMLVVTEVAVAPDADLETAQGIVNDALVTSPYVYVDDDHPVTVLIEDEGYHRTIRGKGYVADLRDENAYASDVTRRSLAAFEERGVPTPTRRFPPESADREAERPPG